MIKTVTINTETHRVVPIELTEEDGFKHRLIGEFKGYFEDEDEDGDIVTSTVIVSWSTIKEIHKAMIEAAPDVEGADVVDLNSPKEINDLQELLFDKGILLTGCELKIMAIQFEKAGLKIIREVKNDE